MKTKRFILGLASTLLLALGLVRAAEFIHPVATATPVQLNSTEASTISCASIPCSTQCNNIL